MNDRNSRKGKEQINERGMQVFSKDFDAWKETQQRSGVGTSSTLPKSSGKMLVDSFHRLLEPDIVKMTENEAFAYIDTFVGVVKGEIKNNNVPQLERNLNNLFYPFGPGSNSSLGRAIVSKHKDIALIMCFIPGIKEYAGRVFADKSQGIKSYDKSSSSHGKTLGMG